MTYSVREIEKYDLERIAKWRMLPEVTKYMPTDPVIDLKKQPQWLKWVKESDNLKKWIIEVDKTPIGVISLSDIDMEKKSCSWGYYIGNKALSSLKLVFSLEMSLYDYVFDSLGLKELHNEVFTINKGVVQIHLACGSWIEKVTENEVEKNGKFFNVSHMSITKDKWNEIKGSKKYEKIKFF
jgi:UDP-4-amino-4,6-dideoxy-N-acetyl-beta-L-altrosamine N-acetyltransferase